MKREIKLKPHETAHLRHLKHTADFRQQQAADSTSALESYVKTLFAEYSPNGGKAEIAMTLDTIVVEDVT